MRAAAIDAFANGCLLVEWTAGRTDGQSGRRTLSKVCEEATAMAGCKINIAACHGCSFLADF